LYKPKQRGENLKNYPRDKKGHTINPENLNLNLPGNEDPEESKQSAKETAKLIGSD